jgi:hypothetical protein
MANGARHTRSRLGRFITVASQDHADLRDEGSLDLAEVRGRREVSSERRHE